MGNIERIAASIVTKLKIYFEGQLRAGDNDGCLQLWDDELGAAASCCTTGEAAVFYALDWKLHGGNGLERAVELVKDIRRRQLPDGAFGQPYYVKKGDPETVDIAEIGAVADSLYLVFRATGSESAKSALLKSAGYLMTQVAAENKGAVYKNNNAREFDVLNGDMYAAHTLGRAYELDGDAAKLGIVQAVFEHLAHRFGKHAPGWWPYIEDWNGAVRMGNSVSYQAIIVAFGSTCLPLLPQSLQDRWSQVAEEAVRKIIDAMKEGANDDTEAPWWCRDWGNVWEIDLALWRYRSLPEAEEYVLRRLELVDRELSEQGGRIFTPKSAAAADPDRAPVSTTFRKAATFAGILSYMLLERTADFADKGRGCTAEHSRGAEGGS